jgi:hypothetical protein
MLIKCELSLYTNLFEFCFEIFVSVHFMFDYIKQYLETVESKHVEFLLNCITVCVILSLRCKFSLSEKFML